MPGDIRMNGQFLRRMALVCLVAMIALWCAPAMAESAGTLTATGDDLVDQGKYDEALGYYAQAIALEPRQAMAWAGRGVALNYLGRYVEAKVALEEAIAISPGYAKAWYQKGIALSGLGQYEDAIIAYDKALEIYPEYGYLAYYGEANALSGLGRYTEAIPLYEKALSLEPRYAEPWAKKGDALAATGDYKGAVTAYDKSLSIDPNYIPAMNARVAAAANLSGVTPGTTISPKATMTSAPTATALPTKAGDTPRTNQGIPLPPWLAVAGIAAAVCLSLRRT